MTEGEACKNDRNISLLFNFDITIYSLKMTNAIDKCFLNVIHCFSLVLSPRSFTVLFSETPNVIYDYILLTTELSHSNVFFSNLLFLFFPLIDFSPTEFVHVPFLLFLSIVNFYIDSSRDGIGVCVHICAVPIYERL